ncbi:Eco57I restriction-modification methylase domain-containing protein [Nonomuraea sp. KM88]|uniref:Eco57I restriction-modification methylase domain-containing protein n=1 Tax=Nonomuraea sp. KM88 TaxID=3457427 RepID=UPI003FCDA6FF
MTFKSIVNQGEYISSHYLAALLKNDLEGLRRRWRQAEKSGAESSAPGPFSSAQGLKGFGKRFFEHRTRISERLGENPSFDALRDPLVIEQARELNDEILRALCFAAPDGDPEGWLRRTDLDLVFLDKPRQVPVALAVTGLSGLELVVLDATWATDPEGILDKDGGCRLLTPIVLDGSEEIDHAGKAVEFLFGCEEEPRYVLLLAGNVVLLADSKAWPSGYLAVDLSQALHAMDDRPGGELETVAALFGAESLITYDGHSALADLVGNGRKHAVSVSKELREALRHSVELIAQEILDRVREQGADHEDLGDDLAGRLTEQSLRYLYRILFLLYAEARPELGILPSKSEAYKEGYGLARLGETVSYDLPEEAEQGLYLHDSLSLLFSLVDQGYQPPTATEPVLDEDGNEIALGREGIRFEALKSTLFDPRSTALFGESIRVGEKVVDTRLRNKCLWRVLNMLMLSPESRRGRKNGQRGFISYAQLGINQLGAVYEGLMSYTGFFAPKDVNEVAQTVKTAGRTGAGEEKEKPDPSKGTWIVPTEESSRYAKYIVKRPDPVTGEPKPIVHDKGSFVYRLSGRERQRSASYYTPEVLTECTVRHALEELLTEATDPRDILDVTICEPALGSGAFLNEAINQLADRYMRLAQDRQSVKLLPEELAREKQKVKAYIALHNCYGVDLNATAVELAEVSIWLNVMHQGLEAPWFGLHLRPGNSLIGARRAVYHIDQLKSGDWRTTPPLDRALTCDLTDEDDPNQVIDRLAEGEVHHFLLPAEGWGAIVDADQTKELTTDERDKLREWRRSIRRSISDSATQRRLTALAQRVERLWELTRKRIAASENEIRRRIPIWGLRPEDRPLPAPASGTVTRDEIVRALYEDWESPYNRLKTVMDAWCALWFWPVGQNLDVAPPTLGQWLDFCEAVLGVQPEKAKPRGKKGNAHIDDIYGLFAPDPRFAARAEEDAHDRFIARCKPITEVAVDDRFAWWTVLHEIAKREGFFHWELEFAQVFAKGGFDLQVGNPPWVRPTWDDKLSLAEYEPWFMLEKKIPEDELTRIRAEVLCNQYVVDGYLLDLNSWAGLNAHLGSNVEHPVLAGVQTNLYTNFMDQTWRNSSARGTVGLIHPESHFVDPDAEALRAAAYARLRRHFHFRNELQLFEEIMHTREYGIHVYGPPRKIEFTNLSWIFRPDTIDASLSHNGDGNPPGIQLPGGGWDTNPHALRVVRVDEGVLADWALLADPAGTPPSQASLLRPLTALDNDTLRSLADSPVRLGDFNFWWTTGLHEKGAKKSGLIEWRPERPESLSEVVLQGTLFTVATPFSADMKTSATKGKDIEGRDLENMPERVVPRTGYQRKRSCSRERFDLALWVDKDGDAVFGPSEWRVVWRRMVDPSMQRTLHAALIPPGPAHTDGTCSLALSDKRHTAVLAGLFASLPFDYVIKVRGKMNVFADTFKVFPAPLDGPLVSPLLLRALRLNCLTEDFAPLWEDLFDAGWLRDRWAGGHNKRVLIQGVEEKWTAGTPLRTEFDRRMALVEIDALAALILGIPADGLIGWYRSQFGVLRKFEWETFFAPDGHKICANKDNLGMRQTEEEKKIAQAWLKAQKNNDDFELPEGWVRPEREKEMTRAYKEFQRRLEAGEYSEAAEL